MTQPDEPLALSAPLARRLAPELCHRDPATGESCAAYHGLWQYLRLMGLTTTPTHHADFLRSAFDAVASTAPAPRVLISGTADYALLAQVLAAFRARNVEPVVTVLDVCETPLMLNRWYAERARSSITTCRADIRAYSDPRPYDVVCTHSFLGRFTPAERVELIVKWRQLLRPGGIAVTVNRLRPGASQAWIGFSSAQVQAFRATVLRSAESLRESLQADPIELAREAGIYASRQGIYPVRSREEVEELFAAAGFRIDHLSCAPIPGEVQHGASGPTVAGGAEYAHIIATRP